MRRATVLLVLGLALASCDNATTDSATTDSAATGSSATGTVIEATLRVRAEGCGPRTEFGTATSIGDGLVVTAAHVVAGAAQVELVDHRDSISRAQVVWFDPARDVAALRPVSAPSGSVVLSDTRAGEGSTGVIAVAADDGSIELRDVEVVQRVTILTTDIYRDTEVRRSGLRIAASVEPGDSGAMVHLAEGGVGIVWSRSMERADQAWTVDLPEPLLQSESRAALVEPVDVGPCP